MTASSSSRPIGDRLCSLRIEKEGHAKNGPLWLVRDWGEPKSDD